MLRSFPYFLPILRRPEGFLLSLTESWGYQSTGDRCRGAFCEAIRSPTRPILVLTQCYLTSRQRRAMLDLGSRLYSPTIDCSIANGASVNVIDHTTTALIRYVMSVLCINSKHHAYRLPNHVPANCRNSFGKRTIDSCDALSLASLHRNAVQH
jgi:hypothetical protein